MQAENDGHWKLTQEIYGLVGEGLISIHPSN